MVHDAHKIYSVAPVSFHVKVEDTSHEIHVL